MSIWKKLKKSLGFSNKDKPSKQKFQEITITRDNGEPITFHGQLINQAKIEKESFDLMLKLYLLEDTKVILESKYIDPTGSVHKALEFDTVHAAGLYIQSITEGLKDDRVLESKLIQ